ncbi:MAG: AarF/ABC1/UbiB kinase family protein [Candidatus Latescibacteria bacterium]|jgi:ubiquinone biosynthesis protein|nr:AarF/ABC1/UbiB kinase family protein [Candidatus Latescibacterota bacterium]
MAFRTNLRRLGHLAGVIGRHLFLQVLGPFIVRRQWLAKRFPQAALTGPKRLRIAMEEMGGTFIKFGQMLALQPDILPFAYCRELADLLDRIAPFDYCFVEKAFLEDFGKTPEELFDRFDRVPISTASIGQVYRANLGGRQVAVKVRRPAVEIEFAGDVRLMTAAIKLIRQLYLKPLYWMIEPMSEFVSWTNEELDYRYEARYMARLRNNARENAREQVPAVYWDYTTRRILVAEFLEGVTVLTFLRALESDDHVGVYQLKNNGFEPESFARHIIDNFLGDAFQFGLFHADLHPANLMILTGNTVGYVDFGITGVLSHYSRQHLIEMTLAYTRGDLEGMAEAFFKVTEMDAKSDLEGFQKGLIEYAEDWYENGDQKPRLKKNFTLVMLDMLLLSRKTNIWPERDVIKYIRSSIAIDGLITRFAPGFDVGFYLETVCNRFLKAQTRQSLIAPERMMAMTQASGNLLRDGALRIGRVIQSLANGDLPIEIGDPDGGGVRILRNRAVYLSGLILGMPLMMIARAEQPVLGLNFFTAELGILAATVFFLVRTVRKLV